MDCPQSYLWLLAWPGNLSRFGQMSHSYLPSWRQRRMAQPPANSALNFNHLLVRGRNKDILEALFSRCSGSTGVNNNVVIVNNS
jgi:hypothetical protein